MSTERIPLEPILSADERARIDAFCAGRRGVESVPALVEFLNSDFGAAVATEPEIVAGFLRDSSNLPGAAAGVARPASVRECAAILRACSQAGVPVTISAGRSNLTGSATPEGGLVLSTVNLREPAVSVDAASRTAVAPVGMIVEDMRREVERLSGGKLVFPVDPTSRADAAVGGAIACNASGFIPGDDGAMRAWVDSVDALLPGGALIRAERGRYVSKGGVFVLEGEGLLADWPAPRYARPRIKNASGPWSSPDGAMDVVDLLTGSEGIFGLVTACRLRLRGKPGGMLDLFVSLPGEADALRLYRAVREHLGGRMESLNAFEYFGVNCRRYMEHETRLFRGGNQVGINFQLPLWDRELEPAVDEWLPVFLGAGVEEDALLMLDNESDRKIFMEARHSMPANAVEAVKRRGTFTIMTDTVVPPERFPEFLEFTHSLLRAEGFDYLSFGHLGDCHLHFTILPESGQVERGREAYDRIVAKSAELGGVYSGEHGTGRRKRRDFALCYGPAAVEAVRRCKAAVDPSFVLNRGVVIEPPGS